jgi:hypothetical protein
MPRGSPGLPLANVPAVSQLPDAAPPAAACATDLKLRQRRIRLDFAEVRLDGGRGASRNLRNKGIFTVGEASNRLGKPSLESSEGVSAVVVNQRADESSDGVAAT